MVDPHRLRSDLAAAAAARPGDRAQLICTFCVAAVPVAGAAISMMADANRRDILYASDTHATELEELEFELGEGPCVEAFASGRPVLIPDLDDAPDPRWPMFAAAARSRTPARSAFAFPLQIGAIAVGILDLYRVEPGPLSSDELAAALLVADAALWLLLSVRAGAGSDPGAEDGADLTVGGWPLVLHRDHAVVYQATGMVIAQAEVKVEAALARLRAYAFARSRPLQDVATGGCRSASFRRGSGGHLTAPQQPTPRRRRVAAPKGGAR